MDSQFNFHGCASRQTVTHSLLIIFSSSRIQIGHQFQRGHRPSLTSSGLSSTDASTNRVNSLGRSARKGFQMWKSESLGESPSWSHSSNCFFSALLASEERQSEASRKLRHLHLLDENHTWSMSYVDRHLHRHPEFDHNGPDSLNILLS